MIIIIIFLVIMLVLLIYAVIGLNGYSSTLEKRNDELKQDKDIQMQKRFKAERKLSLIDEELCPNNYSSTQNLINKIKTILESE